MPVRRRRAPSHPNRSRSPRRRPAAVRAGLAGAATALAGCAAHFPTGLCPAGTTAGDYGGTQ